jgi:5-methylcytosine-specific restriction endonuclease McrA
MLLIDKTLTLKLNRNWLPVGVDSVRDAFKNLTKGTHHALHITWPTDEDGAEIYNTKQYGMEVVSIDEWLTSGGRQCDRWVNTGSHINRGGGRRIRIPTVLIALNYDQNVMVNPPLTADNIRLRDNDTCQYTGKKISRRDGNIDHIVPLSRGGETTWENCVWASRRINTLKGDTPLGEFSKKHNLNLIRKPKRPKARTMMSLIKNKYKIPDWDIFLPQTP